MATDGELAAIFQGSFHFKRTIVEFHLATVVCYENLMDFGQKTYIFLCFTINVFSNILTCPKASPVISQWLPLSEGSWDMQRSEFNLDPTVKVL